MTLSAPSVSAKLRAAGFGIVATRNREGIRVSRGATAGRVCIAVDIDRPGESRRTAALLQEWLDAADVQLGWRYTKHPGEDGLFTVWAKEPVKPEHAPGYQAAELHLELRRAALALENAVRAHTAPAQADITAARTALEALIELAGGDQ